ncbi:CLUMA_CG000935, isoform A [Clunio marinus]|uniref:CLUMA_CG000935, isoform A n=1 Tax=Clunio marinus TaxID=568069 RepID=A0A1J1HHH8_9DIPT|nr:CLUMA_CG000935, isoform A [Clunio marinus]
MVFLSNKRGRRSKRRQKGLRRKYEFFVVLMMIIGCEFLNSAVVCSITGTPDKCEYEQRLENR